jgi:ElaB/YqjD/DUF883 family membrane-anchored ribosome-binding protein
MRNRETIEKEMYRAREDLEDSLAELKHVVQDKVDVKARARVAVERGKEKAQDVFERGKEGARQLAERGREGARERPVLVSAVIGGIIAAGVLVYVGRQKNWW